METERRIKLHCGLLFLLLKHSSPEDDVIIKVIAGTNAGDGALRSETGLDEGPRVEHAQQRVNENLQPDKRSY